MNKLICTILLHIAAWSKLSQSALSLEDPFPSSDTEWITLSETESFQPAPTGGDPRLIQAQRQLAAEYSSKFANSATYYDEYSQAWRMLGMYIDCNVNNEHHRQLEDANNGGGSCRRYLLWAAYVDLNYQGGGIGEYQYHDLANNKWDTSACHTLERCAKMDCHLADTHFSLLGFFKNYDYDDFFEQLFKHQAYCLWSSNDYSFMSTYRQWWPQGCTSTGKMDSGSYVYMDIKPQPGGALGLGLYTDSSCTVEYKRNKVKLANVVSSHSGNNLYEFMDKFNSGLSVFQACQPCKAYSLSNNNKNDENGAYGCKDDAGYNNVNQCMKFKTHTGAQVATYKDVSMASQQGTITRSYAADMTPSFWSKWGMFTISVIVFVAGIIAFIWSARPPKVVARGSAVSNEPFLHH